MFQKTIFALLLLVSFTFLSFTSNTLKDALMFLKDSKRIMHYKYMNNEEVKERFTGKTEVINDKEYRIQLEIGEDGAQSVSYYRQDSFYFYKYDSKSKSEGVVVPVDPKMGEVWSSADQSIKYEVIAIDKRFRTPEKKYKSCIWIKGIPQQNPYGIRRAKEYLHYVKGEGLVCYYKCSWRFLKICS